MPQPKDVRPYPPRLFAAAFVLALALLSVHAALLYPFPLTEVDEHGHVSYVAHLFETAAWWPNFEQMRLYRADNVITDAPNYINHPPLFYWVAAPIYGAVKALGVDPLWIRAFPLTLAFASFFAIAVFAMRFRFGALGFLALFTGMAVVKLPSLAMLFNNDQMALLGGAVACFGAARRLAARGDVGGLSFLLAGVALSSVKLTSFLLVGGFAFAALTFSPRRGPDVRGLAALLAVVALATTPYVALLVFEGGLAPETAGQAEMLRSDSARHGWADADRLSLLAYIARAPTIFASQFIGGASALAILSVMVAAQFVACAPGRSPDEEVAEALVRAALAATLATFIVHVLFAYRRHVEYGWLGDLYPRYYFPLIAVYGLGWLMAARRLNGVAYGWWMRRRHA